MSEIEKIVKKAVIAHALNGTVADVEDEDIRRFEDYGYLTENRCRNGHTVVWYLDNDDHNACFDLDRLRFLEPDEIEEQLA